MLATNLFCSDEFTAMFIGRRFYGDELIRGDDFMTVTTLIFQ